MSEIDHLPPNKREVEGDMDQSEKELPMLGMSLPNKPTKRAIITLLVVVYINLLNYMDRFTVSSVLSDIQKWFSIKDEKAGLLQTVFICSYMVFAPIFGYLGDRFSRKYVMAVGITIWTITTFAGSLMGRSQYYGFLTLRGLVGIGEASYSTVAPTIIADLFVGDQRTKALSLFYFAIPCGSGLGYIAGSKIAALMNEWQWALRVTPALGIIAVLLTLTAIHEPKRGASEATKVNPEIEDLSESVMVVEPQSYIGDLKKILRVRSFIWATAGFTCVSFVIGALSWWAPKFALYAEEVLYKSHTRSIGEVSYIFGLITFASGIVGVWVGAEFARRWRVHNMKADALVCAIGIILATPSLFFALWLADKYIILTWVLIGVGEVCMCFNWAPNGDILLYVIPPNCRATAEAIQILIIHIFGDAFSPFVVGAISDAYIKKQGERTVITQYLGLLYSLYITPFVCCFGAFCYFFCARYLYDDKNNVDMLIKNKASNPQQAVLSSLPSNSSQPLFAPTMQDARNSEYEHLENPSDRTFLIGDSQYET